MKGLPSEALPPLSTDILYPDTDPDAMPENPPHFFALVALVAVLRHFFARLRDWYIVGDVYWYYEEGNSKARKAPDLMVIKGVDPRTQRRSFKSWQHGGARPCFILEIASGRTVGEDLGEKRSLYERLGVKEYFLFDPEGDLLPRPMIGYRLNGEGYEELSPDAGGRLLSEELGLWLLPDGDTVAFADAKTGERLRDLPETSQLLEEIGAELEEARDYLERERQHAEQEQQRAEQAEQRAEAAEKRRAEAEQQSQRQQQQIEDERRRAEQAEQRAAAAQRQAEKLAEELARLRSPGQSTPEETP